MLAAMYSFGEYSLPLLREFADADWPPEPESPPPEDVEGTELRDVRRVKELWLECMAEPGGVL